jgi:hypothetical protein
VNNDRDKSESAAKQKQRELEREIREHAASVEGRHNMLHTLAKMGQFYADAVAEWKARAAKHGCNVDEGDPDCG